MFDFSLINVWGTIAAAMAVFALGALWFSPALFMKPWSESLAKRPDELGSPAVAMGLTLVTTLVTSFAMALLFQAGDIDTTGRGIVAGFIVGVGIVAATSFSDALFVRQARVWWLIQVLYRIVGFVLMGAIIGASSPDSALRTMEREIEKTQKAIEEQAQDAADQAGKLLEGK